MAKLEIALKRPFSRLILALKLSSWSFNSVFCSIMTLFSLITTFSRHEEEVEEKNSSNSNRIPEQTDNCPLKVSYSVSMFLINEKLKLTFNNITISGFMLWFHVACVMVSNSIVEWIFWMILWEETKKHNSSVKSKLNIKHKHTISLAADQQSIQSKEYTFFICLFKWPLFLLQLQFKWTLIIWLLIYQKVTQQWCSGVRAPEYNFQQQ